MRSSVVDYVIIADKAADLRSEPAIGRFLLLHAQETKNQFYKISYGHNDITLYEDLVYLIVYCYYPSARRPVYLRVSPLPTGAL